MTLKGDDAAAHVADPAEDAPAVAEALGRGVGLLALRMSQFAVQFVSGLIVTRVLGPAGRGQYAVVLALALTVFVVANLSLDASAGRMLARRDVGPVAASRMLATGAIVLGLIAGAVTVVIGLIGADAVFQHAGADLFLVAGATLPLQLAGYYATNLLARLGELRIVGLSAVAGGVAQLTTVVLLALGNHLTPLGALAAFALGTGVMAVVAAVGVGLSIGGRALVPGRIDKQAWQLARTGASLHPTTLTVFANMRLDLFVVSAMLSSRETGLYSLAVTLAELLALAAASISASALKGQTFTSEDVAISYTIDFCRQLLAIAAVCAVVVCAGAYPFVILVYGPAWQGTVVPLIILAIAAVALTLENPMRILLGRVGRPRRLSTIAGVSATANLALNLALIPFLGIVGSALASLVSYWMLLALMLAMLRRHANVDVWSVFRFESDDVVARGLRGCRRFLSGSRPSSS